MARLAAFRDRSEPAPANGVVLRYDFSTAAGELPIYPFDHGKLDYVDGQYRILLDDERVFVSPKVLFTDKAEPQLTIEATTQVRSADDGAKPGGGVGCLVDRDRGFFAVVKPLADLRNDIDVQFYRVDDAGVAGLWKARTPAVRPDDSPNRIELTCQAYEDGEVSMTLRVNGAEIPSELGQTKIDERGFVGIGVISVSEDGGSDVRFDDLVVRVPVREG